jgi:hypothetical protein
LTPTPVGAASGFIWVVFPGLESGEFEVGSDEARSGAVFVLVSDIVLRPRYISSHSNPVKVLGYLVKILPINLIMFHATSHFNHSESSEINHASQ